MDVYCKRKALWGSQTIIGDYTLEVPADGECKGVPDDVARKLLQNNKNWLRRDKAQAAPAEKKAPAKKKKARAKAPASKPSVDEELDELAALAEEKVPPKRGLLSRLTGKSEADKEE
jgi:hypothetical protein